MAPCIVCKTETTKYRCPKCMERYCSVTCCRAHKELCCSGNSSEVKRVHPAPQKQLEHTEKPCFEGNIHPAFRDMAGDTDEVPESLLHELSASSEIRSMLGNPHLRAMMENLVNTDKPDLAMAAAMREPIFTELADTCLRIVDKENPNLEPEATLGGR
ncbi:Zinc finger hit domain-containing protein 3 [Plakobranchus ocellatus]|uniref:Zinc finger hit domain-containing protein 3 n=1 Tax=Plakobranchus ocellatus TaxID=259542 RepID=A0AAV4A2T0_9GAST|nr:Zinc finger hit domain-containing protein 3 [Plakobranchus ocellatus]